MASSIKRVLGLCLMVCLIALSAPTAASAQAQQPPTELLLQPQGLDCVGIYALRQMQPDLTGVGVKFAVIARSITYIASEPQNDYRPNTRHNCFRADQFDFHNQADPSAGVSPHSTAICSILLGEDPNAFHPQLGRFYYQGAAPQAKTDIYEFWHFLTNNVFAHLPPVADIVTASIGSQFQDWWTRGVESLAEHYGLIVVAGIGNGSDAHDPVLYPAAAANVIGVGVVDPVNFEHLAENLANLSLAHPEHSSAGPTEDGRCKPDIVAPGNCLTAGAGEPNSYQPTGNGTSFSTPIVAGTIGLLVQKTKQDPNLAQAVSPDGGNTVMKAILMNSATKLPYWHKGKLTKDDDHQVPLDYVQGAGMLNAVDAFENLIAGQGSPGDVPQTGWDNNVLNKRENLENIYTITIAKPTNKFVTATITWNNHFSTAYPFQPLPEKNTNLLLELWAVDPNDSNNDYLLDYSDSPVDNVEHIHVSADPNYSQYEIVVSYSYTDDPNQIHTAQQYGLAWNVSDKHDDDNIFWYDLNADGVVNKKDLLIMLDNWTASTKSPEGYFFGDINADGTIDIKDLQAFLNYKDFMAN